MKGQNPRANKPAASSPSQNTPSQGSFQNGHRRSNSRYNGNPKEGHPSSSPQADYEAVNDKLLEVLARSLGKVTIATVSSGARYQGMLQAADTQSSGPTGLSVVLHKPVLISKSILEEKTNVDDSLPEKLVIHAKDLIDIEVGVSAKPDIVQPAKEAPSSEAVKSPEQKTAAPVAPIVPAAPVKPAELRSKKSKEPSPLAEAKKPEASSTKVSKELAKETPTHPPQQSEQRPQAAEAPQVQAQAQPTPPPPSPPQQQQQQQQQSQTSQPPQPEVYKPPRRSEFRTDKDISSTYQVRERELQRWTPDDESLAVSLDETPHRSGAWDQFKVNEEKFGVESSYDEHLYTTKINKDSEDYKERLERAKRLAREIEGQSTSDRHVLEERGIVVDDSGMDEEDKYSGVQNEQPDTRGSELMAALRNSMTASPSGQEVSSKGAVNNQTRLNQAHHHDDPAIVSSSGARKQTNEPEKVTNPPAPAPEQPSKPSSIPPKPPIPTNKSFRLNAQSEINALREFSANFKVPHKMPNDLLPILAKDKSKQDEILKRQDSPKKTAVEPRKENKFKLNPKAAAFTPSFAAPPTQKSSNASPIPSKASFGSPQNPSPRIHNQKPYSGSSASSGASKRHHKITAAEFFGGHDKVPTAKSQKEKIEKFKQQFNMFITAQKKHTDKSTPLVLEKAFQTPPTWDSNIEETYQEFIKRRSTSKDRSPSMFVPPMGMPFMASPMMGMPATPQMAYPAHAVSPVQGQHAGMAAQFQQQQQQQQQMAMMYQMQAGIPPGAQMMFPPPDPQFLPPGGFMMPAGFVGSHSPVGDNVMMGAGSPYAANANLHGGHQGGYNNHHGTRRYNQNTQGKRGNSSQRGSTGGQ